MALARFLISGLIFVYLSYLNSDSLHPRRPRTEEDFIKLGHHESTPTTAAMEEKLNTLRDRRGWQAWDLKNPMATQHLGNFLNEFKNSSSQQTNRPPNILLIFADDLGYGDLGVQPFVHDPESWPCSEGGMLTPNLQRMASQGTIATNFHSASPVCSPSRVSMMTGLYPWRLGATFAFELGRDLSQRNLYLPQTYASTPALFRNAGYKTLHSGKWHLGGMREEYRVDRVYHDKCSYPSPNQHGFDEYISELDGPESPRYTFLLGNSILHSKGHRHLLRDDIPMPKIDDPKGRQNTLSDHEAGNAIKYIKYHQKNFPTQPWFVQVWFNAPHGPWEVLDSGQEVYNQHYEKEHNYWRKYQCKDGIMEETRTWQYKTMISAMDRSIGRLLDTINSLGIEKDTLIVFTSDNGPEAGAGTAGPYRGIKRSLLEGGVRIPAIFQWVGTIPSNSITTAWGAITDMLPTFLDAASIRKPKDLHLDGISFLPALTKAIKIDKLMAYHRQNTAGKAQTTLPPPFWPPTDQSTPSKAARHLTTSENKLTPVIPMHNTQEFQAMLKDLFKLEHHAHHKHANNPFNITFTTTYDHHIHSEGKNDQDSFILSKFGSNGVKVWPSEDKTRERMFLWHYFGDPWDTNEDRYQSAAYYHEVKIITSSRRGCLDRVFDLRHDPYEQHNLITYVFKCNVNFNEYNAERYKNALDMRSVRKHCEDMASQPATKDEKSEQIIEKCLSKYSSSLISKIEMMYPRLAAFVKHGNEAHQRFMNEDREKVVCNVPYLNQTIKLRYITSSETCLSDFTCSQPEN